MTATPLLILVTGGAGFVGSHLCERLVAAGHHVISLDNYFTGSRDNHVPGVEYRVGHTKDIARLVPEIPDHIYHLGEYSRVEQSVLEPELVEDLNIVGTAAVIEFWKNKKCKLVYAGSSTKFGDNKDSPYARTKALNTERIKATGEQMQLPYAITYFYNVYGPRERSGVYGTVVEHFKRMYESGAPCAVVSPGTQARNFTHVADIVDGLVVVGERGQGDEYGLGNERAYSIHELAELFGFGDHIVLFPPRPGNRMASALDTTKARSLGWQATRSLEEYVRTFRAGTIRGHAHEKRVLVFSTTMHPVAGLAEEALVELVRLLPDVHFDVVTTRFSENPVADGLPANITLHHVGVGAPIDKFLFPFLGALAGRALVGRHRYLFTWSIMASYAALAALILKWLTKTPLLITLGDQNLDDLTILHRVTLRLLLSRADQVYGTHGSQEAHASHMSGLRLPRTSLGEGDAFANALRYAYADIVRQREPVYQKKRILIVSLAYHPYVGGAEIAIREITDRISDIEFHMVTLRFRATDAPIEQVGNVLVHRISCGPGMIGKGWFQFAAFLTARALHQRERYDAVWAMMAHSSGVPAGLFKTFFPRVPYVLTLQEGDPPEHVERVMRPFGPLFTRAFTKADVVQVISTFLGEWAKRRGFKGPVEVIPNGVDVARFTGPQTPHEGVVLVTTSRLVRKNAIDDVLRALPALPHITFNILGVGPDEAALKALTRDLGLESRVHFLGQVNHADLPAYLHASDIFIRPSRSEGMGNSFIEAMAAGLPVIATQEGGLSDFITPEVAWVVPKDSPGAITKAIEAILANQGHAREVTARATAMVRDKYDWSVVARDMYERVFKKVIH